MVKPLPRSVNVHSPDLKRAKYFIQHLTGVVTPLPKIGVGLKNSFNRYSSFYKGLSREVGGSIIKVCWYVRDAIHYLMVNKSVGVRLVVANLGLRQSGRSELDQLEMLMPVNIGELRMVAIVLLNTLLNYGNKNVLDVAQSMTYNLPILNRFGLGVDING